MAIRFAIASGDNNQTSTWNGGATLGLPTSADDVFTNGFTVNMVANATYISMNNSARARDIATPTMVSNVSPSPYVVAASNEVGGAAWRAFDKVYATNTGWQTSGVATGWLSFDFNTALIIDGYTVFGSDTQSQNPRNWTFEGSNDNTNWTVLHTVTLAAGIAVNGNYQSPMSIGNTTAYRYYRINISLNGGSATNVRIVELELYQQFTNTIASGGSFNFNTAGVTVTCTSTSASLSAGATNLITVTATTGTVTLNLGSSVTPIFANLISYTGNCNFNFTASSIFAASLNCTGINKTSTGTLTANCNIIATFLNVTSGFTQYGILSSAGDTIVNGNILGNPITSAPGGVAQAIRQTAGNLTINGNIVPEGGAASAIAINKCAVFFSGTNITLNGNTLGGDGLSIASSGTVTINGTLNGGNSVYANSTITVNMNGNCYAGNFAAAINCSAFTSSVVNLTGNMYNSLGRMAIWCPNVFISNTATTLWRVDTGGGDYKFLYSADTTPNLPATTNVRSGVTYGPALSLTGTMVVPAASNVRTGVAVDNTVGTGELTSADIISGINASSDPLAVRLKNALTDVTAGNIISQYKDS